MNTINTVLIVDDNAENLKALYYILMLDGYKVRKAMNGEQAIESVKDSPPDIILLDIQMPKMNGYETCKNLKDNPKTVDIPVIFISALSDGVDKVKAFDMGGVDYIEKPFRAKEALARVRTHLTIQKQKKELKESLQQLKQSQSQLIQSEKMASLGVLSAGIAHEINNPMNFVYVGVVGLEMNLKEIKKVIEKYSSIATDEKGDIKAILKEIELLKSECGYDKNMELIFQLVEDIKIGAERTIEIVKGISTFSRNDTKGKTDVDIHESLELTLNILKNKYRDLIEIKKDFDPELPLIKCNLGQINQVFMNLINNAIDAFKNKGKIIITTQSLRDSVQINIKDNGKGMTEEVQRKVFDPFFTTKDVGSGTGLGLSISHGIIENHGGNIELKSEVGKGTEFIIKLPK